MAIAIIIVALIVLGIFAYFCVDAYQRTKNPEKWAKFLDDAGVKRD
jgi:heme/copper-type cytochrome/quinol oxidase subunit 2